MQPYVDQIESKLKYYFCSFRDYRQNEI